MNSSDGSDYNPDSEAKILHVSIDPRFLLGEFLDELGRVVAGMDNSLRAIADGSYLGRAQKQPSALQVGLQRPVQLDADSESQRVMRDSMLAVLRAFGEFVDRLIAFKEFIHGNPPPGQTISDLETLDLWIRNQISLGAVRIGANGKLKAPAKIRMVGANPQWLLAVTDGYLALRRTLEHHHGVSQVEFSIQTYRMRITTGEEERDIRINDRFQQGEHIEVFWEKRGANVPAGRLLTIAREGVEHIAVSLAHIIAPTMLNVVIDPANALTQVEMPIIPVSLFADED